jgi:hypothetical protein
MPFLPLGFIDEVEERQLISEEEVSPLSDSTSEERVLSSMVIHLSCGSDG